MNVARFESGPQFPPASYVETKAAKGRLNYLAGLAAEEQVAAHYQRLGYELEACRWRGRYGEIDLIMRKNDQVIFVEVKKSSTIDRACALLRRRQMDRICTAAMEFVGTEPNMLDTDMRFDLAAMDSKGMIEIIENAFGAA
ncbi:MAG: YraN family protein [Rhodobacteraceae bacterium]|nr:YraN family protein [Paracoccaceae bacterium]